MTPAFANSSLNLPISARIFRSGRTPASESLLALTMIMNRIGRSLCGGVSVRSSYMSNGARRDRHDANFSVQVMHETRLFFSADGANNRAHGREARRLRA